MAGDTEGLTDGPHPPTAKRLSSAERMRLTRARKRDGMRVIPVEVSIAEVNGLIQCGFLPQDKRGNRDAVAAAFGAFLDKLPPSKWPALFREGGK